MIIMSKFIKRLTKSLKNIENCIILGDGFGHIDDIIESFNTVFFVGSTGADIKLKNTIYIENYEYVEQLSDISCIIVNRSKVKDINRLQPFWIKKKPLIIFEGSEVIERDFSEEMYRYGYRAVEQYKDYHVWQKIK